MNSEDASANNRASNILYNEHKLTNNRAEGTGSTAMSIQKPEATVNDHELQYLVSADHVLDLLRDCGRKPQITAAVLSAAFELCEPGLDRERLLGEVKAFFRR